MKRIVIIFALFVLLANTLAEESYSFPPDIGDTGDTVFFGRYEQDNNLKNGAEPIEWIVLDRKDENVLLLSRYVLDSRCYNDNGGNISWENCSIREWLNNQFYHDAFNEEESGLILETNVLNGREHQPSKKGWKPTFCTETIDKVFLLSVKEYKKYDSDSFDIASTGATKYANKKGAKGVFWNSNATQLTRSSGDNPSEASYIYLDIDPLSTDQKCGIRPALWISDQSSISYENKRVLYNRARDCEYKRQYAEAAEKYEQLGKYNGSDSLAQKCRYLQATELMKNEEYANAIPIFEKLGDHNDSKEMLIECRYQYAESLFEAGNYSLASELYDLDGHYKDSIDKLIQCLEKLKKPVHYFDNDNIEFLHTRIDSGYSKNKPIEIKKGDVHYNWTLGQFFLSGFTSNENEFSDHPVFVKAFGDTVTLRFHLTQDIDHLYGDKNLKINYDKNTYDDELFRENMDFGKGALIIRHTNHENKSRTIGPFYNYLYAEDSTVANTKVDLNQEGEYIVALDYEIKKGNVLVGNPYENYSIRFKFAIRNGDCPVHLLDSSTKNELFERNITNNGFSILIPNNNSLIIHVRCYSVLTEPSGRITLNLDFDRISGNAKEYTKGGIYIISITDPKSNEHVEKTVFVGNEELREQYDAYNRQ